MYQNKLIPIDPKYVSGPSGEETEKDRDPSNDVREVIVPQKKDTGSSLSPISQPLQPTDYQVSKSKIDGGQEISPEEAQGMMDRLSPTKTIDRYNLPTRDSFVVDIAAAIDSYRDDMSTGEFVAGDGEGQYRLEDVIRSPGYDNSDYEQYIRENDIDVKNPYNKLVVSPDALNNLQSGVTSLNDMVQKKAFGKEFFKDIFDRHGTVSEDALNEGITRLYEEQRYKIFENAGMVNPAPKSKPEFMNNSQFNEYKDLVTSYKFISGSPDAKRAYLLNFSNRNNLPSTAIETASEPYITESVDVLVSKAIAESAKSMVSKYDIERNKIYRFDDNGDIVEAGTIRTVTFTGGRGVRNYFITDGKSGDDIVSPVASLPDGYYDGSDLSSRISNVERISNKILKEEYHSNIVENALQGYIDNWELSIPFASGKIKESRERAIGDVSRKADKRGIDSLNPIDKKFAEVIGTYNLYKEIANIPESYMLGSTVLPESLAFVGEMAATGPVRTMSKSLIHKGLEKAGINSLMYHTGSKLLSRGSNALAYSTAALASAIPTRGFHIYADIIRRGNPHIVTFYTPEFDNIVTEFDYTDTDGFMAAVIKSYLSASVEIGTEMLGDVISKTPYWQWLNKSINDIPSKAKSYLAKRLNVSVPGLEKVRDIISMRSFRDYMGREMIADTWGKIPGIDRGLFSMDTGRRLREIAKSASISGPALEWFEEFVGGRLSPFVESIGNQYNFWELDPIYRDPVGTLRDETVQFAYSMTPIYSGGLVANTGSFSFSQLVSTANGSYADIKRFKDVVNNIYNEKVFDKAKLDKYTDKLNKIKSKSRRDVASSLLDRRAMFESGSVGSKKSGQAWKDYANGFMNDLGKARLSVESMMLERPQTKEEVNAEREKINSISDSRTRDDVSDLMDYYERYLSKTSEFKGVETFKDFVESSERELDSIVSTLKTVVESPNSFIDIDSLVKKANSLPISSGKKGMVDYLATLAKLAVESSKKTFNVSRKTPGGKVKIKRAKFQYEGNEVTFILNDDGITYSASVSKTEDTELAENAFLDTMYDAVSKMRIEDIGTFIGMLDKSNIDENIEDPDVAKQMTRSAIANRAMDLLTAVELIDDNTAPYVNSILESLDELFKSKGIRDSHYRDLRNKIKSLFYNTYRANPTKETRDKLREYNVSMFTRNVNAYDIPMIEDIKRITDRAPDSIPEKKETKKKSKNKVESLLSRIRSTKFRKSPSFKALQEDNPTVSKFAEAILKLKSNAYITENDSRFLQNVFTYLPVEMLSGLESISVNEKSSSSFYDPITRTIQIGVKTPKGEQRNPELILFDFLEELTHLMHHNVSSYVTGAAGSIDINKVSEIAGTSMGKLISSVVGDFNAMTFDYEKFDSLRRKKRSSLTKEEGELLDGIKEMLNKLKPSKGSMYDFTITVGNRDISSKEIIESYYRYKRLQALGGVYSSPRVSAYYATNFTEYFARVISDTLAGRAISDFGISSNTVKDVLSNIKAWIVRNIAVPIYSAIIRSKSVVVKGESIDKGKVNSSLLNKYGADNVDDLVEVFDQIKNQFESDNHFEIVDGQIRLKERMSGLADFEEAVETSNAFKVIDDAITTLQDIGKLNEFQGNFLRVVVGGYAPDLLYLNSIRIYDRVAPTDASRRGFQSEDDASYALGTYSRSGNIDLFLYKGQEPGNIIGVFVHELNHAYDRGIFLTMMNPELRRRLVESGDRHFYDDIVEMFGEDADITEEMYVNAINSAKKKIPNPKEYAESHGLYFNKELAYLLKGVGVDENTPGYADIISADYEKDIKLFIKRLTSAHLHNESSEVFVSLKGLISAYFMFRGTGLSAFHSRYFISSPEEFFAESFARRVITDTAVEELLSSLHDAASAISNQSKTPSIVARDLNLIMQESFDIAGDTLDGYMNNLYSEDIKAIIKSIGRERIIESRLPTELSFISNINYLSGIFGKEVFIKIVNKVVRENPWVKRVYDVDSDVSIEKAIIRGHKDPELYIDTLRFISEISKASKNEELLPSESVVLSRSIVGDRLPAMYDWLDSNAKEFSNTGIGQTYIESPDLSMESPITGKGVFSDEEVFAENGMQAIKFVIGFEPTSKMLLFNSDTNTHQESFAGGSDAVNGESKFYAFRGVLKRPDGISPAVVVVGFNGGLYGVQRPETPYRTPYEKILVDDNKKISAYVLPDINYEIKEKDGRVILETYHDKPYALVPTANHIPSEFPIARISPEDVDATPELESIHVIGSSVNNIMSPLSDLDLQNEIDNVMSVADRYSMFSAPINDPIDLQSFIKLAKKGKVKADDMLSVVDQVNASDLFDSKADKLDFIHRMFEAWKYNFIKKFYKKHSILTPRDLTRIVGERRRRSVDDYKKDVEFVDNLVSSSYARKLVNDIRINRVKAMSAYSRSKKKDPVFFETLRKLTSITPRALSSMEDLQTLSHLLTLSPYDMPMNEFISKSDDLYNKYLAYKSSYEPNTKNDEQLEDVRLALAEFVSAVKVNHVTKIPALNDDIESLVSLDENDMSVKDLRDYVNHLKYLIQNKTINKDAFDFTMRVVANKNYENFNEFIGERWINILNKKSVRNLFKDNVTLLGNVSHMNIQDLLNILDGIKKDYSGFVVNDVLRPFEEARRSMFSDLIKILKPMLPESWNMTKSDMHVVGMYGLLNQKPKFKLSGPTLEKLRDMGIDIDGIPVGATVSKSDTGNKADAYNALVESLNDFMEESIMMSFGEKPESVSDEYFEDQMSYIFATTFKTKKAISQERKDLLKATGADSVSDLVKSLRDGSITLNTLQTSYLNESKGIFSNLKDGLYTDGVTMKYISETYTGEEFIEIEDYIPILRFKTMLVPNEDILEERAGDIEKNVFLNVYSDINTNHAFLQKRTKVIMALNTNMYEILRTRVDQMLFYMRNERQRIYLQKFFNTKLFTDRNGVSPDAREFLARILKAYLNRNMTEAKVALKRNKTARFIQRAMQRMKVLYLGNVGNSAAQLSSAVMGMQTMTGNPLRRVTDMNWAVKELLSKPNDTTDFITKHMEEVARRGFSDYELVEQRYDLTLTNAWAGMIKGTYKSEKSYIGELLTRFKITGGRSEKFALAPLMFFDRFAARVTAMSNYKNYLETHGLEHDPDNPNKEALEAGIQAVRETQATDNPLYKPAVTLNVMTNRGAFDVDKSGVGELFMQSYWSFKTFSIFEAKRLRKARFKFVEAVNDGNFNEAVSRLAEYAYNFMGRMLFEYLKLLGNYPIYYLAMQLVGADEDEFNDKYFDPLNAFFKGWMSYFALVEPLYKAMAIPTKEIEEGIRGVDKLNPQQSFKYQGDVFTATGFIGDMFSSAQLNITDVVKTAHGYIVNGEEVTEEEMLSILGAGVETTSMLWRIFPTAPEQLRAINYMRRMQKGEKVSLGGSKEL